MAGKTTHGATVKLGGTALVGVNNIKVPPIKRGIIDDTTHDTTVGKEKIPEDLYELGDCVITMDYIAGSPTDGKCLSAMTATAGSPVEVIITVKAAEGKEDVAFNAYGTNYELMDLPSGSTNKQQCTLTLTPTGPRNQAASA